MGFVNYILSKSCYVEVDFTSYFVEQIDYINSAETFSAEVLYLKDLKLKITYDPLLERREKYSVFVSE